MGHVVRTQNYDSDYDTDGVVIELKDLINCPELLDTSCLLWMMD